MKRDRYMLYWCFIMVNIQAVLYGLHCYVRH